MSSLEVLQSRERLRVGQHFLRWRPHIAGLGALGNAAMLQSSSVPALQKAALGLAFGTTIAGFGAESWWLGRRPLTESWLLNSLGLTLGALGAGALLSGGLTSPVLPLLFAPVVVGFAAFARGSRSWLLLGEALVMFSLLGLFGPLDAFPELPISALRGMLWISATASLALLSVGVISLVDAHVRIAGELDRLRADMLHEAERRASSVEHLGAHVAHEVKNPLAAARGLVQLVERHLESERDKRRLAVVVAELDRALAVLQDYLSFARPLSDLRLGAVPLLPLLEDVAGILEARAHEKGVTLQISGENLEVLADRQRLRDAILNLALNAITALPRGGKVVLSVARARTGALLTVADDGVGMSAELLERLGQPFTSASEGGTGLGVMLAESVTRQHGGELRFESAPGKGSRALLELPLGKGEPRAGAS
ncbi:MAG: HAMP domain-containing sensor histidine kinase [Pseudomonadota bacterium]